VLVEDKLFATLDTTVRALKPETKPRVLVSDTVGFIKKLPHDLVASFRSTLAEALEASLLLAYNSGLCHPWAKVKNPDAVAFGDCCSRWAPGGLFRIAAAPPWSFQRTRVDRRLIAAAVRYAQSARHCDGCRCADCR
jgi:hypothetical protein